jgi:excisionase family DNA binding protein
MAENEKEIIDVEEAARYLGIHIESLRNLARQGKIPGCRKLGRKWYFSTKDLNDFIRWGLR